MKKLILACIAVLLLTISFASATEYEIKDIAINGLFIDDEKVALDLGTRTQIDVWVKGLGEKKDVKVKAWIGGYEYDDVEAVSEAFDVKEDIVYRKELYLDIPRDLDVENKEYKLHIEVYDKKEYLEKTYSLFIQERMHDVSIQDVIIRPGTMIDAGRTLAVQVRLENFGKKKEQDIKVEVSIPQLGVSSVTWVDLLDVYGSDDSSESTSFLPLNIPRDAPTGDFQVKVTVYYSRLHNEVSATRLVYVNGVDVKKEKDKESMILISSKKEHSLNEETEYNIAVANLGKSKKSYSIEVSGLEGWADYVVMPEELEVMAGVSGEAVVKVTPSKVGMHQFSVVVKEGDTVLKETLFNVDIPELEEPKESVLKDKKNIVLGIMIVVLVFALLITLRHSMKPKKDFTDS